MKPVRWHPAAAGWCPGQRRAGLYVQAVSFVESHEKLSFTEVVRMYPDGDVRKYEHKG